MDRTERFLRHRENIVQTNVHDLLVVTSTLNGKTILTIWQGRQQIPRINMYFADEKKRSDFLMTELSKAQNRAKNLEEKKARKKNKPPHPFKEGDILSSSWGYDQTNVDFFQVTKTSPKCVWVREIGSEFVEGNWETGKVMPVRDDFKGEEARKFPQFNGSWHLRAEVGFMRLFTGQPKYCSNLH